MTYPGLKEFQNSLFFYIFFFWHLIVCVYVVNLIFFIYEFGSHNSIAPKWHTAQRQGHKEDKDKKLLK